MSTIILLAILFVIILINLIWILTIELRLKKIFTGTKAHNLEDLIISLAKKTNDLEKRQGEINKHLSVVDTRLNKSIRSIETIRFNPFTEASGNQSFAIAFINDENNGVVISSLYARDRMSIFAKPITNGKSDFELTTEEKEVLNKSVNKTQ